MDRLHELETGSIQCCVTSPPYWGLRDYGVAGQLGLERTPEEYVAKMVAVFREVKRVLWEDGTLWLNLGDSYAAGKQGRSDHGTDDPTVGLCGNSNGAVNVGYAIQRKPPEGLKPKDLVGIPWRVAFALQADGWYLRSDIIWHKPNPMPESVTDRPTKSHEYIFLMSKSQWYFYDAEAIKEPNSEGAIERFGNNHQISVDNRKHAKDLSNNRAAKAKEFDQWIPGGRNKRTVWTVATSPYSEAHFATFPPDLIKPCILAGTKPGDTVLDPFGGSGTTGQVALELGRKAVLIELNPEYVNLINQRTFITPGLALA